MFFLRLLTNKDVIHINFHSPQALPTLHLLLADFVGTSDLRQEWQTRRLFCALPEAAWQGRGLQSTASPCSGQNVPQRWWHRLVCEGQLLCVVQGASNLDAGQRGLGEGMGLVLFLAKSSLTLSAARDHLWEEWRGPVLSMPRLPSFAGDLHPLGKLPVGWCWYWNYIA